MVHPSIERVMQKPDLATSFRALVAVGESQLTAPAIGVTQTAFTEGVTEVNTIKTMYFSVASRVTISKVHTAYTLVVPRA